MAPLAEIIELSPTVWGDIYEYGGCYLKDHGEKGMGVGEIRDSFSGYNATAGTYGLREDGWYDAELGRETHEHCIGRAMGVAERLKQMAAALEQNMTIVMVMHFDFIDILLRSCLAGDGGEPVLSAMRPGAVFQSYNCAMSVLDIDAGGAVNVLFTNRHDYMPDDLVKKGKLGLV